ncbi:MAG: AlpA family transcriptional regulator [Citromicrobium sp.]|nr:AlpA family transcriptional regulator [Citromicrobium sp.]
MEHQLLNFKGVCDRTSLSRSTIERMVEAGEFPQPFRITPKRLAFRAADVDRWIRARLAACERE